MRRANLGVYPLLPYVSGVSAATVYSDEFFQALFDERSSFSLRRYWQEVSSEELALDPTVHPLILLEGQAYVDRLTRPDRLDIANEALQILFELDQDPTPYDSYVFIIAGRSVDGGSSALTMGGRVRSFSVFGEDTTCTFMAHELGHVLGLDHPFDTTLVNPTYRYGEYGDPTCIMSAENFGGRPATFPMPAGQRPFISASATFWSSVGPGVSPATVWRYSPTYPQPLPFSVELPAGAAPTPVRINRAGAGGVQLVAMPTGGANPWYLVEYRPAMGWDRGLGAGVVVHQVRASIGTPADGPSWPKTDQVCLAGTIPLPSAGLLDWSDASFAVRVIESTPGWVELLVGASLPRERFVRLVDVRDDSTFVAATPSATVEVHRTGADCATRRYTTQLVTSGCTVEATIETAGYAEPAVQIEVNGVLSDWLELTTLAAPVLDVPITAADPVAPGAAPTFTERRQRVVCVLDGNRLELAVGPGAGRFDLTIACHCQERGGGGPRTSTAPVTVTLTTAQIQLPPEAVQDQVTCIRHSMVHAPGGELRDQLARLLVEMEEWAHVDTDRFGVELGRAVALAQDFPALGRVALGNAAAYLHTTPAELRRSVAEAARAIARG